jgi:hypothetical protein
MKGLAAGGIASLIGVLVFIMVASNLIGPILTAITDAAGLAVVGSVSGGSALILVIATVFIAGLLVGVVELLIPGTISRATRGRVGRSRSRSF